MEVTKPNQYKEHLLMAIVRIQLPCVNLNPASCGRPRQCPKCSCEILQKWGIASKPLRDTEWEELQVYR